MRGKPKPSACQCQVHFILDEKGFLDLSTSRGLIKDYCSFTEFQTLRKLGLIVSLHTQTHTLSTHSNDADKLRPEQKPGHFGGCNLTSSCGSEFSLCVALCKSADGCQLIERTQAFLPLNLCVAQIKLFCSRLHCWKIHMGHIHCSVSSTNYQKSLLPRTTHEQDYVLVLYSYKCIMSSVCKDRK